MAQALEKNHCQGNCTVVRDEPTFNLIGTMVVYLFHNMQRWFEAGDMIIERNPSGSVTAFQKITIDGVNKVGFICEADGVAQAVKGIVQLVAKHCTITGQHPASILERVEIK